MSKAKYIMTRYSPIIFQEGVMHNEILGLEIESAGFVNIDFDEQKKRFTANCYGESISLNMKSNPENDKIRIEKMLNGAWF